MLIRVAMCQEEKQTAHLCNGVLNRGLCVKLYLAQRSKHTDIFPPVAVHQVEGVPACGMPCLLVLLRSMNNIAPRRVEIS